MKVIEANEGQKISYSVTGDWLNIGNQIMLNLKTRESDNDVHIDITSDMSGQIGTGFALILCEGRSLSALPDANKIVGNAQIMGIE